MARRGNHRYPVVFILFLLLAGRAFASPSNTMSISPSATAGQTITASDENSRNSTVTSTYNAHSHTDISDMSGVNSFEIGDGAAGNKSFTVDDDQSASPALRFNTTSDVWQLSNDGSTFSAINISSGVVISGENLFRIGDGSASGNKRLVFNEDTTDGEIRWNTSSNALEISNDGSTFSAMQTVSGAVTSGVNEFYIGDGTSAGLKYIFAHNSSSITNPYIRYNGSQWEFSNTANGSATALAGRVATGSFTRDTGTASGSQSVTGVGFTPRACIFFQNQDSSTEISWGFSTVTAEGSLHDRTAAGAGTYGNDTGAIFNFESAGVFYRGVVSSFDANGFTITWTRSGAPTGTISVYYLAFE